MLRNRTTALYVTLQLLRQTGRRLQLVPRCGEPVGGDNTSGSRNTNPINTPTIPPVNTLTIPPKLILSTLKRFHPHSTFYLRPEIPNELLYGMAAACGTVAEDVLGLIDCRFLFVFGESCILFCRDRVRRKAGFAGDLRYDRFTSSSFVVKDGGFYINERYIMGSAMDPHLLLEIFRALQQEFTKLSGSPVADDAVGRGFSAIAGMTELKASLLAEVVEPLRNPERFKKYNLGIPNGILFFGPPGCGKTYIAQRLGEELNYNYMEVSPSEIGSSHIHGTSLKIRDLFESAAQRAPTILFIDEFEGIAPSRESLSSDQQFKAEEVSELLVQIGQCAERKILLIAATNLPSKIDPAVRRTGRLDKKIYIGPPDEAGKRAMLAFHLRGRPLAEGLDTTTFCRDLMQGYSASDIKVLADEAARIALSEDSGITIEHLAAAVQKVPPSIALADTSEE